MVTELRPSTGGTTNTTSGEPGVPSGANDRTRFSILIADDDRGTRETLGEMLAARGFRIMLAADGGEAVELVQVDLVHLVLFDMHMPRLTGLEAFAVIRQTLDRILPAVLMTADANNDLIRQAFAAQVYSVIPKPVNGNVVLHTLERALTKVYGPRPAETAVAGEARDVGLNRLRPAETAVAGEARDTGVTRPKQPQEKPAEPKPPSE
jgi:two-component system, response regulator PdtaR